jgi:urease accessory protein
MLPCHNQAATTASGLGVVSLERAGAKTVVARAFATSPLKLLLPNNHGPGAWVYVATLGGGLVGGDRIDLRLNVASGGAALLGTQASTKVYRSADGCGQRIAVVAGDEATVALVPDPVVCFAGAHYDQQTRVTLGRDASLLLVDGYTSGRKARGERWQFGHLASRTTVERGGRAVLIDATRLDPRHGPLAHRMGRFDVVLTVVAMGPRMSAVREAMLVARSAPSAGDRVVVAASPLGSDGAILRVIAERFEAASLVLRPSFAFLTEVLGDDPFARKW